MLIVSASRMFATYGYRRAPGGQGLGGCVMDPTDDNRDVVWAAASVCQIDKVLRGRGRRRVRTSGPDLCLTDNASEAVGTED